MWVTAVTVITAERLAQETGVSVRYLAELNTSRRLELSC
jgi:hypothetical protein